MIIPIQILADAENVTFSIPSQSRTETIPAYIAQNSTSLQIIAVGEEAYDIDRGKEPAKTNAEQHVKGPFHVTQPFRPETFSAPLVVAFFRYYLLGYYFDIRRNPIERFLFSTFDRYDCQLSMENSTGQGDNLEKLIQEFKNTYAILNIKRLQINGRKIW